ncbi:MAG TPA: CHAT domain-containing tetratricopeptide repeat protein, partial [Thermoanaerobaculia bacterium]|nr:CHAT domain-containing tetratricopeptide repeat protein [Thermoanaerobaculia bacterium]
IGVGWGMLGEPRQAIGYFERALPISRALGDRGREVFIRVYLGIAHSEGGDAATAMTHLNEGLAMSRQLGLPRIEGLAQNQLGKMALNAQHLDEALAHYGEVLRIARAGSNRRGEVNALINLGSVLASMGRCVDARARLDEALAITRQTSDRVAEGATLSRLAQIDREEGKLLDAVAHVETAVEIAEEVRAKSTAQQFRAAYLATVRDQYDLQIDVLMRLGAEALALQASEHARARSLLETLEREQSQIRRSPVDPPAPSLTEIQQLLDDDTTLLEYSLGAQRSYVWAVTRDSLRGFALPDRARIDALARRVHSLASARTQTLSERRKVDEDYRAAAAELSAMILGPLKNELDGRRIVIAAEGALQYMPYAALPLPSTNAPLAAEHEIVMIPSAATLALLRRASSHGAADKTLMVFADPVFSESDPRVSVARSRDAAPRMPRLPLTRLEAGSITRLVPQASVTTALDFDASRATATGDAIRRHRIVHFATHGVLDSEHPEQSGIVLSLVDRNGKPQDGFLRLHDVYNLDLSADLVVLSACQTALGKEIRGEGLIGLTRGFMNAGVPRVVASLWKVDDRATAELMRRFYQHMLGGERLTPAAALRTAQMEMAKSAAWNRPFYWAGFVLQGEWR